MIEWSDEQLMVRDAIRRFIDAEVVPQIDALEHDGVPPYDVIRKLYAAFGMDQMARDRFKKQLERKVSGTVESASERAERAGERRAGAGVDADDARLGRCRQVEGPGVIGDHQV